MSALTSPDRWEATWRHSRLGQGLSRLDGELRARLHDLARHSLTARYSDLLATLAIVLLLFLSPFVSVDNNALLVLAAAGVAAVRWGVRPLGSRPPVWLVAPIVAYMAIALVATAFSGFPGLALRGYGKMVVSVLAYVTFCVALADRRAARAALWSIALAATIVAAYGIYQFIIKVPPLATWEDTKVLDHVTRVYSTLLNPNLLGGYLILTSFLTMSLFLEEREFWRWLALPAALVQLVCIVFTYSTGAYVGAVAGICCLLLGMYFLFKRELDAEPLLRRVLVTALVLGAVSTFAAVQHSPTLKHRVMRVVEGREDSSNNFRMNVWRADRRIIQDNWAVGIGPGNDVFRKIYPLYMVSGFEALAAYNIFLENWTELGIVGLLIFLWLWGAHLRACLGRSPHRARQAMLLCCAAALVGTALLGMVDTVYFRPQVNILFWFTLALIGMANPQSAEHNGDITTS